MDGASKKRANSKYLKGHFFGPPCIESTVDLSVPYSSRDDSVAYRPVRIAGHWDRSVTGLQPVMSTNNRSNDLT